MIATVVNFIVGWEYRLHTAPGMFSSDICMTLNF